MSAGASSRRSGSRAQFERWFLNRDVGLVVMEEACGLAHHWARWLNSLCIQGRLPAVDKGKVLRGVRHWALQVQARSNHDKAASSLANKFARICYATLRDHATFDENSPASTKGRRVTFAMPA